MTIKTQGTRVFIYDSADTGNEVTEVIGVTDLGSFSSSKTSIPTTHLGSTQVDKVSGLTDNGTTSMAFNVDDTDAGQIKMRSLDTAGTQFRIFVCYSNGTEIPSYSGSLTVPTDRSYVDATVTVTVTEQGSTDDIIRGSFEFDVSAKTRVLKS